jgi:hypothetical protein
MNRNLVLAAWLALALWLTTGTAQARWMNPQTGRFQTMDSYEGNPTDPPSLHKYLYAHNNPINGVDPSGQFFTISSVLVGASGAIGARGGYEGARAPAYAGALAAARRLAMVLGFAYATTQTQQDNSRFGRLLYHYNVLDEYQFTGLPARQWLTDRGDLPFDQALSITFQSGQRLFVYGVWIKSPDEIQPLPPLRPGVNQWQTTKWIPPIRVKIVRTLNGPNWVE